MKRVSSTKLTAKLFLLLVAKKNLFQLEVNLVRTTETEYNTPLLGYPALCYVYIFH